MTNADKFKNLFGIYATELWSMPEKDFLKWLNSEVMNCSEMPNNSDTISRQAAIDALGNGAMVNYQASGHDNGLIKAINVIKGLPSAEPQWIPVTERLPEYGVEVLAHDEFGDFSINHVIDEETGDWFFDGVVAWMPLPKPWKGADDKTCYVVNEQLGRTILGQTERNE